MCLLKNMFKKKLLYGLFVFSVFINILFISPYLIKKLNTDSSPYFEQTSPEEEVIKAVVNASMHIEESQMIQQEFKGLLTDVKALFKPQRNSHVYNNYYKAYNLAGLSQYAYVKNDEYILDFLAQKADSWINSDGSLSYELIRIDQCPIGILYINLYKKTQDLKYKKIAEEIYEFLKSKRTEDNLIPYHNKENNFSDAIGMFVPFLMEYNFITQDSLAKQIAIDNINEYKKNGTDPLTGIPSHGYNLKTGIKVGSSNWGRGIGWYLLALAYCNEGSDEVLNHNIHKLPYTQFPLSSSKFDSSTAIMFELYKNSIDNTRDFDLSFIKTHIRKNGWVSDCSGDTYNLNDYSKSFGNSELCNGLLLLLYAKNIEQKEFNK